MDKTLELKNSHEKSQLQEKIYPREQAVNFAYGFLSTGSIDFFKNFLEKQNMTTGEFILEVGRDKLASLVPDKDAEWSEWYSFEKLVKIFSEYKNVFVPGINTYVAQWIEKSGSSTSKLNFFEKMGFTPDQFKEPILKQIKNDLCNPEEYLATAKGIKKEWKISDDDFIELQREAIPFRIQYGHKDLFEHLWTSEQMSDPELIDKIVQGGIAALNKHFITARSYDLIDFRATESGRLFMKLVDADKLTLSHREIIQTELRTSLRVLSSGETIQGFNDLLKGLEEIQKTFKVAISDFETGCAYQLFSKIKQLSGYGVRPVHLNTETLNQLNCSSGVKDEFKKMMIRNSDSGDGFKDFEDLGVARELFLNQLNTGKISIFHINSLIERCDLVKNAPEALKTYIRTVAPKEIRLYNNTLNEYTLELIRKSGKELFSDEEYQEFEQKIATVQNDLREEKIHDLPELFSINPEVSKRSHVKGDDNLERLNAAITAGAAFDIDLVKLVSKEQVIKKLEHLLVAGSVGRGSFLTHPESLEELLSHFDITPREFFNHIGIVKFTESLIFKNSDYRYTPEEKLRDMFNGLNLYEFSTSELQYVFKEVIGREFTNYSFSIQDLDTKFKYHAQYLFGIEFKEVFEEGAREQLSKQFFGMEGRLNHAEIKGDVESFSDSIKELWDYYGFTKEDFTTEALVALALYDGLEREHLVDDIKKHFNVTTEMLKDQKMRAHVLDKAKIMIGELTLQPEDVIIALNKNSIELSNRDIIDTFPTVKQTVTTIEQRFPNFNIENFTQGQLIQLESLFFHNGYDRSEQVLKFEDTFSWWAQSLSVIPEVTSVAELEIIFPEAAEFASKVREKVPELSDKLLESVSWFCELSQEYDIEPILESFKNSPFLIDAINENPRYSMKLIRKFPHLDADSQENISKLYSVKAGLSSDGLSTTKDSLEFRSATQIQLLDFKENRKIAEKISQHTDLNQWLNYDQEKYITLGNQDSVSFAEMVKTPVLRINETISLYRDSIKAVLGEYHQELSQFRIPLESAKTIDAEIVQLKERIARATEQGESAKVAGMTKGLQSLEQKRNNLKTAPLWNKITGDFDAVVQVGNDVLTNHELITTAEQAYRAPVDQVITREERTRQLEFKKQMSKFQNDFKDKLNLLERRMNQFTQSIANSIAPCLGKERSNALMQDLRDRTLEALDHFSSDVVTTQEMISARESNTLSKLDGRPLKIEVWSRDPDIDLYLGNYTDCCIRIDSEHMGDESTIADYLTDLGVQVIKVTDEQTNEPVLAAWAYLGELENDKPTFVIDNVEANTTYSAPYHTQLSNLLGEYIKEYANAVGIPAENIVQGDANNDIIIDGARLGQSNKLGLLYNRIGGYYLEAEQDDEYIDGEYFDENDD